MCHVYYEPLPDPVKIIADIKDFFNTDFLNDITKSIPGIVSRMDPNNPVLINMSVPFDMDAFTVDRTKPVKIQLTITIQAQGPNH